MSSGQWEVVGKNKKDKTTLKKQVKNEKNKTVPAPKVEDILPLSQVKNIYNNMGKSNKENKKPQEKDNKQKDAKKPPAKKPEKKPEAPKPKPPKSIESALNMINVDDFKSSLEISKQRFPEAPLVWLKELSSFLNAKLTVDLNDPVFTTKPDYYPMSKVPSGVKQAMDKALTDAGKPTAQVFFDYCLTAMANDMSKGLPGVGHKLWIQFLAQNNPQLSASHLNKYQQLWTSYQNRQPIGLSILWGLGQGGFKDFNIGLKVFKEFMLPLLDSKNYSRFIIKYLLQLLTKHENLPLSKDNYMFVFDLVNTNRNLPKEDKQELANINKKLKDILFSNTAEKKYSAVFEALLSKTVSTAPTSFQKEVSDILFNCLNKDASCYNTWKQIYSTKFEQSCILLKYISDHWRRLNSQLNKKQFKELLNSILVTNTDLHTKHKKDATLTDVDKLCKVLLDKMTVSKSFPWKFFTFVLLLTTTTLLIFDLNKHGHWKKTHSVRTLKQIGVWEYGELAWEGAHQGLNWTRNRIEEYAPGYLDATGEYVQPYIELTKDFSKIAYNAGEKVLENVKGHIPIVFGLIDKYAPGLIEKIEITWNTIYNSVVEYSHKGHHYLTTEVFVGQLSPENIKKVALTSFDNTQNLAIEYYNWACEKVQSVLSGK